MKAIKLFSISAIMLITALACSAPAAKKSVDAATKAKVQAVMNDYIKQRIKRNVYSVKYAGKTIKGKYDYLHKGVKNKGGHFVSCADVKVGDKVFDMDYWVKEEGGKLVVVKELLHKIKDKDGKKTLVNAVQ